MERKGSLFGEKSIFRKKGVGTALVLIVLVAFFSLTSKSFLSVGNLLNMLLQVSNLIIISVGMTWVIITGGIDFSCGAAMGFSGVATTMLIKYAGVPVGAGIVLCVLIGGVLGLFNGLCITKLRIPPLLATIGTDTTVRGLAYLICDGETIFGLPEGFTTLGRGYVWVFPIPVLIAVAIFLIFYFVQEKTAFSVFTYAIGGNADAAHLSGIKTSRHLMALYGIAGLLAGLAGFINSSRMGVGLAGSGDNMATNVVTAVVLGGTSIAGGSGNVQGTILGCLIIGVLTNGMTILNVHSFAQQTAQGLILLLAIGAETIRQKKEI